jgi:hypothetical protein
MSVLVRGWFIAAVTLAIGLNGAGAVTFQKPVAVKREILALYDGAQEGAADLTRIHRIAELPLNHLGFVLRFHDIRTKLPEPQEMERYRAVLTWFVGSVGDSNLYLAWVSKVARMNVRYVILGDIGVSITPANMPIVNQLLNAIGLRHTGDEISPALGTRVVQKDAGLIEFECPLDPVLSDYPVIAADRVDTRSGLTVETPFRDGKRSAVLVAIGRMGGYAALNYEYCHQRPPLYRGKWLINPFAFFRAALGSDGAPMPDTTTASGNRLYFNVVDNKGWTRSSGRAGDRDRSIGDIVLRDLIEAFDDLPTSINLQNPEIEKVGTGGRQAVSRSLSAGGSVDLSLRHLRPTLSRFDDEYPSISNLAPLVEAGPGSSINLPMSDESYYVKSSAFGGSGFSVLQKTLSNTERPRRLAPFNLNYHAQAAEYPAVMASIKGHLHDANRAVLTPISETSYASIVDGFLSTRIDQIGDAVWSISDRAGMQTVRFDHADGALVDIDSSQGVIGQKRSGASLYVALDAAVERATIVLGPRASTISKTCGFSLVESRWRLQHVVKRDCALTFEAQGYGPGSFIWSDVTEKKCSVVVMRNGRELLRQTAEHDSKMNLEFILPIAAIDPVIVQLNCAPGELTEQ